MIAPIRLNERLVGPDHPVYVVAEMSANHGGSLDTATKILDEAKRAGADAVKVQTYTPDTLTIECDNEFFRIGKGTLWEGRTLYDLYVEAFTPWEWLPALKAAADRLGLDLFSSPFDATAVDLLEGVGVPAYKIASFELVDLPLIRRVAKTGKPLLMSVGMATLSEIEEAVRTARESGATEIALLKCTSAYPAPPEEMNLRAIPHLADGFGVPVGLSDHTLGVAVPIAGVAMGACIIEKHLTLSRAHPGPDSAFSLEPHEFKIMVEAIRVAEKALGSIAYGESAEEAKSRVFRRSLFVIEDMESGDEFTEQNVRSIRPGHGLHTRYLTQVLGRHASRDIPRGTPLAWNLIA